MKGKINHHGCLEIERAGKTKDQYCPFINNTNNGAYCGDWCPHFREPIAFSYGTGWELPTCKHCLYFTELIDERIK